MFDRFTEVIPRDMLKDAAVKVASLIGIGALASVALAALMWPSRRG